MENLREPAGSGRAVVETVLRSPPKAAAVRHHRALHFSDVAAALARVDGHPLIAWGAAGDPVRSPDGGAASGGSPSDVGRVRLGAGGVDGAGGAHEALPAAPGAVVHGHPGRGGRGARAVRRRFRVPRGEKFSRTSVATALRAADINATGRGFRSSFKDWARHEGVDELLSEFALAHVEGSKTVAAYARDDLLEKRRPVMQAWSDYVGAPRGA